MRKAGWDNRRAMAREQQEQLQMMRNAPLPLSPGGTVPPPDPFGQHQPPANPFDRGQPQPGVEFDPLKEQYTGIVMGIAMSKFTKADGEEHFRVLPGDDIQLSFPTAGARRRS